MNYWPLSAIATSPLFPQAMLPELYKLHASLHLSGMAFCACTDVARSTAPVRAEGLAVIESTDAPARCIFTEYPTIEAWLRWERIDVLEASNGALLVLIEGLH